MLEEQCKTELADRMTRVEIAINNLNNHLLRIDHNNKERLDSAIHALNSKIDGIFYNIDKQVEREINRVISYAKANCEYFYRDFVQKKVSEKCGDVEKELQLHIKTYERIIKRDGNRIKTLIERLKKDGINTPADHPEKQLED